jgi:hypothetical protein
VDEYHRMIEAGILDLSSPSPWATASPSPTSRSSARRTSRATATTVEVLLDPDASAGACRARAVLTAGESLTTEIVPGLAIDVAGLFR